MDNIIKQIEAIIEHSRSQSDPGGYGNYSEPDKALDSITRVIQQHKLARIQKRIDETRADLDKQGIDVAEMLAKLKGKLS